MSQLEHLTTEAPNPASARLDALEALEIVRLMNAEDAHVAAAVGEQAEPIAAAIEAIAERFRHGGRLIYLGAGTSGRLGVLDATECPPTFNSPPGQVIGLIAGGPSALTRAIEGAEDRPELAEADLQAASLAEGDVVVGIATSGRTPYVIGGLRYARQRGALAIALACNEASTVSAEADLTIAPIVGPEVLSGSTRLKAGTATKLVLNMLTTGAMVRIGKAYGNLMVDLRATNNKLRDRTERIVSQLTQLTPDAAAELLARCDGELKTAVVMHRHEISCDAARERLAAAGGHLRTALESTDNSALRTPHSALVTPVTHPRPQPAAASLLLGIDGGGTGTVALLGKGGGNAAQSVVGRGTAGPSNPQAIGFPAACAALEAAIAAAFSAAGLPRQPVEVACLALAGAARESDRALLQEWSRKAHIAHNLLCVTDAEPLLAAGTPQGWGIALISGTGSLAWGRNPTGKTARAGGWGHLFGDEGSAYQLVLAALRAVGCASDGRGPPTKLSDAFLAALDVVNPADLVTAVYGSARDRAALAGLAHLVTKLASEGDAVAGALVKQAAGELASLVAAVHAKLSFGAGPLPLALAGGMLLGAPQLRAAVLANLGQQGIGPQETLVEVPALGALRLAADASAAAKQGSRPHR